jgi:DNA-binding cell septation regulator SpoVG
VIRQNKSNPNPKGLIMPDALQVTVEVKIMERGQLKAFADVTLTTPHVEITLRGFRVVQKDEQPAWVALPSSSYTKDGKIVNSPLLEVSRNLKRQITDAVLAEYHKASGEPF